MLLVSGGVVQICKVYDGTVYAVYEVRVMNYADFHMQNLQAAYNMEIEM